MKKQLLLRLGIVVVAALVTLGLDAIPRKQDRRITLNVSVQETEIILKALGKLPTEESGGLYFNIQYQAQTQLAPQQAPKKDTSTINKSKKQ